MKHHEEQVDMSTPGIVDVPLATAATLDPSSFSSINASEAIPKSWEERAKKAWSYYLEEPIVKNAINSWRTFAVGDEIKFTSDDEDLKKDVHELAGKVDLSKFVKDMILQLLVKGDAVGFKRLSTGEDLEELVSVNPISVKVKYVGGQLIEAKQHPEKVGTGDVFDMPIDQVLCI